MAVPQYLSQIHLRVQTQIRQRHLLVSDQRLLVAVSGGQDSLCLLKILSDLAPRWRWRLFVLHCDHRWTPDETRCAQFVKQWVIDQMHLPCQVETAPTITLDEDRARKWRYGVLQTWAERWQCSVIVTGHTGSDRAETFLFNLIRGSGVVGLSSLDWRRPLRSDRLQSPDLVRPLLCLWRHETAEFCHQYRLPVWPDQTNQDLGHARNRIRQQLIPFLSTHFNPQVEDALVRTATILAAEHEVVTDLAAQIESQVVLGDPPGVKRLILQQQPTAIQRWVIFSFLREHLPHAPRFDQVESVLHLLHAPRRSRTSPFPGGSWMEVVDDLIVLRNWVSPVESSVSKLSKDAYDSASELT